VCLPTQPLLCCCCALQLSALQRYGRDLTAEARRGLLDPVIGRQDVIQRTMQVHSIGSFSCFL
jgi:ATP-dependent Clp protease ATP-binding subunit ClpA